MGTTNIEWTTNPDGSKGKTWNPITGCTKVSDGCKNCYAERQSLRLEGRYGYPAAPYNFAVAIHRDRFRDPYTWKKPCKVFVCSMGDLFHNEVSESIVFTLLRTMEENPEHTFQILTKRPKRAYNFFKQRTTGPIPNIWVGTSVENQATAIERLQWLVRIPAQVNFVSVEPMLEYVDLSEWMELLDWVICGGETRHQARFMNPKWAIALRDQCINSDTPFFFKKMSGNSKKKNDAIPQELFIRDYPI